MGGPQPCEPGSRGDITELNSVSCTSATNCVAVGDYMDQADTSDTTLAEQWNGTSWTVLTTPSPVTFSALVSVSCPSATHCVAVGVSSPTRHRRPVPAVRGLGRHHLDGGDRTALILLSRSQHPARVA